MRFPGNMSPEWLESQYLLWKKSPELVSAEWNGFFHGYEFGSGRKPVPQGPTQPSAGKLFGIQALIHRYRNMGHLMACTDPLSPCPAEHPLLQLDRFELGEEDLARSFLVPTFNKSETTLAEILEVLQATYCGAIGVEFMHVQEPEEREWLLEKMETSRNTTSFSLEKKLTILKKLQEAALFEAFLNRKFVGQTRFSLEGGETLIVLLDSLIGHSGTLGITDIILGTPHRGRLNIQANILGKPYANIFAEFKNGGRPDFIGDGDVKYHTAYSADIDLPGGKRIHVAMAPNPSHLESINPVVEGKVRARQDREKDTAREKILPLLLHGDAAFAGQGIVAETLNLSQLPGYRTGGTLHVVINNQIGFTTMPFEARSTCYATDVAKMLMIPIFHVHGENPEAVVHAVTLALDYRQKFHQDVVVELICYRRHGHNEGDEPYFTQPLMYEKIKAHPSVHHIYGETLAAQGVEKTLIEEMLEKTSERLENAFGEEPHPKPAGFKGQWSRYQRHWSPEQVATGVAQPTLKELAKRMAVLPPDFTPHPRIATLLKKRQEAVATGTSIDWAGAEALAFASLLSEGVGVRLSGQDSVRGTFSQRHSVLIDMKTERNFTPLAATAAPGAAFTPYDSMLSEAGVLGFEYGYSQAAPEILTVWEAQYGDFANGAQVIIDQYIASGTTKWSRGSGLVMLLPHGYEGQGPEHSSARMERFLQLVGKGNIQVAYPSTPAQYFHLLRRQVKQAFRLPLIVFTPKSLLRHPRCVSALEDFSTGGFQEVLAYGNTYHSVREVLICSGKIAVELTGKQEELERGDLAIVRVEQLSPLRDDLLREELERYQQATRFTWVQEEPANMGTWSFIRPYLTTILGKEPEYIGRDEAASPAAGSHLRHKLEQEKIIKTVFNR